MQLRDFEIFQDLSSVELAKILLALEKLDYAPDDIIFHRGDAGDGMYLIVNGFVELFTVGADGKKHSLTVLGEGDGFGEMSLLDSSPRSATAVAATALQLFKINPETFNRLVSEYSSIAMYFLRMLTRRLNESDTILHESRMSNMQLIMHNLEAVSPQMQKVILTASFLPVITRQFIKDNFQIDIKDSEVGVILEAQKHLIHRNEDDSLRVRGAARKVLQQTFLNRFGEIEKINVLSNAVNYFRSCNELYRAVQVYTENGYWNQACELVEGMDIVKTGNGTARNNVMMLFETCPGEILFAYSDILVQFLETMLYSNPSQGYLIIENAINKRKEFFSDERAAQLYKLASEYCEKLGMGTKAKEYEEIAASVDISQADRAGVLQYRTDREHWLTNQNMISARGLTLAEKTKKFKINDNKIVMILVTAFSLAVMWYFRTAAPFTGFTPNSMTFLGITIAAVLFWIVEIIPNYIVAVIMVLLWQVWGVATPAVALSGFASPVWLFVLCILGIGAAISKSGLLYRLSLYILKVFPNNYTGQLLGLAVGGMVLNPLIPSGMTKVSLAEPIAKNLSDAMGFPERSKGSAGLGLAVLIFYGYLTPFLLTGSSANYYAMGIVPGIRMVSWFSWFIYSLPAQILFAGGMLGTILFLFKPQSTTQVSGEIINQQLKILGKMTRDEKITVAAVIILVLLLVIQPFTNMDSTLIIAAVFAVVVIGGVLDNNTLSNGINWSFLIFMGVILSYVEISTRLGLVQVMTGTLAVFMKPLMASPYEFLALAAIIGFVVSSIIKYEPALVVLVPAMVPLAAQAGISSWVIIFVILLTTEPFFFSSLSTTYLTAYYAAEEKAFDHKQGRKISFFFAGVTLLTVLACIPYWKYLGLIK